MLWKPLRLFPIQNNFFFLSEQVLFSVLPNPLSKFIKDLKTVIFSFIWSGNSDKHNFQNLITSFISERYLTITHLEIFINNDAMEVFLFPMKLCQKGYKEHSTYFINISLINLCMHGVTFPSHVKLRIVVIRSFRIIHILLYKPFCCYVSSPDIYDCYL